MKKIFCLILIFCLLLPALSGCKGNVGNGTASTDYTTAAPEDMDFSKTQDEMFTERDGRAEYEEKNSIKIELRGTSAAASSDSVRIDGTTVTITEDATHIISGTLDNGQIIVNAPDTAKLQLVLNGVNITSESSAPLYIIEADKVFVTLAGENTLSCGGTFESIDENNIDGAVFSKQDLTFNGTGSLTVTSPAGHGIVCKDDLVLCSGTYTVSAASHALQANDSIRIKDISLTASAGKDTLHAENSDDASLGFVYIAGGTLNLTAEGDGISAGSYLQIEDVNLTVLAGGGYENGEKHSSENWGGFPGGRPGGRSAGSTVTTTAATTADDASTSMKGIKAEVGILIMGGTYNINSADDSIHSNASLIINGGAFEIASGDDAIHAEESLTVTAGNINISTSYEGLEALHIYVKGGDIRLVATDDGLNAAGGTDASGGGGRDQMLGGGFGGMSANSNGSITVSGGNLYINASGDGMDANGTLEISGGNTVVVGPTTGDTATLDYDKSATITGGTFIGTGASNMAQSFSGGGQGVVALSVGGQQAGTKITVADKSGNILVTHEPELSYQVVIISTPQIRSGETYKVTVGTKSGEFKAS